MGKTQTRTVFDRRQIPADGGSGPLWRALHDGPLQVAPGPSAVICIRVTYWPPLNRNSATEPTLGWAVTSGVHQLARPACSVSAAYTFPGLRRWVPGVLRLALRNHVPRVMTLVAPKLSGI